MSAERAKELAKRMSAVLSGEELPVAATAIAEVMAILIVWIADDDRSKSKIAQMIAKQALALAEAIPRDMMMVAAEEAEKKHAAELLKDAGPKKASPWGNVR